MILTEAPEVIDAAQFAAGLQAASRGVVRVQIGVDDRMQYVSSGWLITDSIVVVPAFALPPQMNAATVQVVSGLDVDPIPASVEHETEAAASAGDPLQPALLRLTRPLQGHAVQLAIESPRLDGSVFLLHHPQGVAELMLSWGHVVGLDGDWIRYDADTEGGSGGAPVFSAEWRVLGMHAKTSDPGDPDGPFNAGVSTSALLDRLSAFPSWPEIAAHHGLADVTAARTGIATASADASSANQNEDGSVDTDLLTAAVSWTIDSTSLRDDLRDALATLVIDPSQSRWMLRPGERTKLIASASIEQLRAAHISDPAPTAAGQRVIDRILAGPPFDLESVEEADLPLWLQAVRWFSRVWPELPTPGEVSRALDRRRSRSRLTDIAGPGFRGRKTELAELGDWLSEPDGGLMAITGIGGVGKSALVAKVALDLPPDAVLLWLDFDRADLAPDNPASVLSILFNQLSLALEGVQLPTVDESSWQSALQSIGSVVAPAVKDREVLLVLDGFEIAQHAPRHEEIWRVIEQILAELPRTDVLISGRAPVRNVELAGRTVKNLHLRGLDPADAELWLRDAGIGEREVLDAVLDMSQGVPLILRLAVGWLESGGKVTDLPAELPARMVEGFLYQRILDRVVDGELKPVARDVLVLRYLTPDMLEPIVGDSLPRGVAPEDVYARLTQEMALVGDASESAQGMALPITISAGSDRLILRPEVRAATVHLLETADAQRVKTIDRRAARWYAKQNLEDPAIRAEYVYHLLRAGDIKSAEAAWRADCLPFLIGAEDELPERATRARAWLRERTQHAEHDPIAALTAWEADAVTRVRAILARGFEAGVADVLKERAERIPDGPLIVYDAWVAWRGGDATGARQLLDRASSWEGPFGRDRTLLAARLAVEAGDTARADELLLSIEADRRWQDRPQSILDATTVTAARIRLAVDLDGELELLRVLMERGTGSSVDGPVLPLPPSDVVVPMLARRLNSSGGNESLGERVAIPMSPEEYEPFTGQIDERRVEAANGQPVLKLSSAHPETSDAGGLSALEDVLRAQAEPESTKTDYWSLAARLESIAYRRWSIAARGPFLYRACDALLATGLARDPQSLAIGGALGAFSGSEWAPFQLFHPSAGPLGVIVNASLPLLRVSEPPPTQEQLLQATKFLESAAQDLPTRGRRGVPSLAPPDADPGTKSEPSESKARSSRTKQVVRAISEPGRSLEGVGVFLLSPDPLDVLVRRVLGVPDQLER